MGNFLSAYGLFLAQLATFVLLVVVAVVLFAATRRRGQAGFGPIGGGCVVSRRRVR